MGTKVVRCPLLRGGERVVALCKLLSDVGLSGPQKIFIPKSLEIKLNVSLSVGEAAWFDVQN